MSLKQGDRVKFYRAHDKSNELTGTVVKVHEGSDLVDIRTEPDGRVIEVETLETTHVNDVTPITESASTETETGAESIESMSEEDSSGSSRRRRR